MRTPFSRHTLIGLNLFLIEMFQQFNDVLGLRIDDPMLGGPPTGQPGLLTTEQALVEQATTATADIAVTNVRRSADAIEASVLVTNKVGHKLPSGVAFRRVFIEFALLDGSGNVLWASGRTSKLGVIVDQNGNTLPTEFFTDLKYQPHYDLHNPNPEQRRITRQDQVQIYEELDKNTEGQFTTSFLSRYEVVKDNRLQPRGWSPKGPDAEHTKPEGAAASDPTYLDGSGSDVVIYRVPLDEDEDKDEQMRQAVTVRATLYSQAIPPYYLNDRFNTVAGPDTQRLHFLASRLRVAGTPIEDWKFKLVSAEKKIPAAGNYGVAGPRQRQLSSGSW